MPIVRSDRRADAIESFREAHENLRQTLLATDAQQANLEDLELSLGLAAEQALEGRDRLCVMHFPAGDSEGHTLDVCAEAGCNDSTDLDKTLASLGEDDAEGPNGKATP